MEQSSAQSKPGLKLLSRWENKNKLEGEKIQILAQQAATKPKASTIPKDMEFVSMRHSKQDYIKAMKSAQQDEDSLLK